MEDVIRQRIKDSAYDDRERTIIYKNKKNQKSDLPELDFEKDRRGLTAIYEDKYKESNGITTKTKDEKLKEDVLELFKKICTSIDEISCGFSKTSNIPSNNRQRDD